MKYDLKDASLPQRLAYGFRITTSHQPDEDILKELEAAFKTAEENYTSHPDQLKGIADTPDGAAYTIVASLLLNLDASITQ